MHRARSLSGILRRLLLGWWGHDRIRVRPAEGRLLRLRTPCLVRVAGRAARLDHRRVGHAGGRAYVVYEGRDDRGACRLDVPPVPVPSRLLWHDARGARVLEEGDVEVLAEGAGDARAPELPSPCLPAP